MSAPSPFWVECATHVYVVVASLALCVSFLGNNFDLLKLKMEVKLKVQILTLGDTDSLKEVRSKTR